MANSLGLKFEDMFKISTKSLRFNRSHPDIPRDKLWKFQFAIIIAMSVICFICLCYSIFFHDIKVGQFAEASKNGTMILVLITITLKYIVLLIHQESIREMIKFVERDYSDDNIYSDKDKSTVLEYAKKGVTVCKFWLLGGFGTSVTFPLKAFVSMAYFYWIGEFKLVAMFEITFPEPLESYKNVPCIFWTWFILTIWFDIYAATMYLGFDPIVPIFLLHVCGQTILLSRRLDTLFTEFKDPREIEEQLKIVIVKLQKLYKFTNDIKTYFSVLYECNMKVTTFLLPLTAFQIIEDLRNHWLNVEFISFFVGSILHFIIPCYYSDLLMEKKMDRIEIPSCLICDVPQFYLSTLSHSQFSRILLRKDLIISCCKSEDFRRAIYSSGWEKCPDKRVRQIILFMITRAKTPMGIRTVFYKINLDTFAEMCRQAYGILNLMNAAWG